MKRARRLLYLIVMAVVVAAIAVFASACGDEREQPATEYTLTFMNGTAPYYSIKGTAGSDVVFDEEEPARTNLVFDGWSETDGGEVVELPAKMPAENKTYYAVFSARYTLTLNPGSAGALAAADRTVAVKAGASLYDVVSTVTPMTVGDATFEAWYYGNSKIDAQSTAVMPTENITVSAKYTVDYVVNIYKQSIYGDTSDASYGEPKQVSGKGYVGDYVVVAPDEGYIVSSEKDNKLTTVALSAMKASNTYNVYYNYREYKVLYNANLASDIEVEGDTSVNDPIYYNQKHGLLKCGYEAEGYHFVGWSTKPNGAVEYRPGAEYTVKGNTTFYAVWSKGLTDSKGVSYDYIYICENAEGKKVSYFERVGFDEVEGTYDEATGVFAIKNSDDKVVVRGIANIENGTYSYIAASDDTYVLSDMLCNTVEGTTLELDYESDTAYYTVDGNKKTGKYAYDVNSSAFTFTSEDVEFAFRLKTFRGDDGEDINTFIKCGKEVGEWYKMEQTGIRDANYYLSLDGFGGARLYCRDTASSSTATWNSFGGLYFVTESEYDDIEVSVIIYANRTRVFNCLLTVVNSNDNEVKVYIEKTLADTLVSADESSSDTLILDGYGIYGNSATYKHGQATTTHKYGYYDDLGEIYLYDEDGTTVLYSFELNVKPDAENAEQYIYTFEPTCDWFGEWAVLGLNNTLFISYGLAKLNIYNNGYADIVMVLPLVSNYYGNAYLDYWTVISGSYERIGETDEYVFTAQVNMSMANSVYSFYYNNLNQLQVDITTWGDFKFVPVYNDDGKLIGFQVVAFGDGMGGETLIYNDVEYTLDGYGKAVGAADEDGNSDVKSYTVANAGLDIVYLTVKEAESEEESAVTETYIKVDGALRQLVDTYMVGNAREPIGMMVLEGADEVENYAVLYYINISSQKITLFSWGKIAWDSNTVTIPSEDEDGDAAIVKYAKYTESVGFNSMYVAVEADYDEFKFRVTEDGSCIAYDANTLDDKGVSTITYNGATLKIDTVNGTAVYTESGEDGVSIEGEFAYYDDVVVIYYDVTEGEQNVTKSINLKLSYGAGGTITSFEEVDDVVGYWVNDKDGASYIYLDGKGNATYYEFNAQATSEADIYNVISGTYAKSTSERVANEYTFTVNEATAFDFTVGYTQTYTPIFSIYDATNMIGTGSIMNVADSSLSNVVGRIGGGGYSYVQYMDSANSVMYYGTVVEIEENVYKFSAVYYSVIFMGMTFGQYPTNYTAYLRQVVTQQGSYCIMLNNLYAENKGVFNLSASYNDDYVNDVTQIEGNIVALRFSGYGNVVYAVYDVEGEENEFGFYYATYNSNTYVAYLRNSENQNVPFFFFRLYANYSAAIADGVFNVMFVNDADYTLVQFNGFGGAVYVNADGVYCSAMYEWVDEEYGVIRLVYEDEYYNIYELYIVIGYDKENKKYVFEVLTLDDSDDTESDVVQA